MKRRARKDNQDGDVFQRIVLARREADQKARGSRIEEPEVIGDHRQHTRRLPALYTSATRMSASR